MCGLEVEMVAMAVLAFAGRSMFLAVALMEETAAVAVTWFS